MSTTTETLVLEINSDSAIAARTALQGLAAAAGNTEKATNSLIAASERNALSLRGQRQVMRGLATDAALVLGPSFGGLSGQLIGLYAANTRVFNSFGDLKTTLGSLLTPTNVVKGGIVGLGAAVVGSVFSWKSYALEVDHAAKIMGTTSTAAASLQAAASFKGIDSSEFLKGTAQFSQNVYLAKNNMGELATLMRANGVPAVRDFEDGMSKVADLIKNATSEQQKYAILQQAGLPVTAEWVKLLEKGSAGLQKARAEAVEFGGAINDQMVENAKRFDEAWNKTSTNWAIRWRSSIVDVVGWFDRLSDSATAAMMKIPGIGVNVPANMLKSAFATGSGTRLTANSDVSSLYGKTGADSSSLLTVSGGKPVDPSVFRTLLGLDQPRAGPLGTLKPAPKSAAQPSPKDKPDDRAPVRRAA